MSVRRDSTSTPRRFPVALPPAFAWDVVPPAAEQPTWLAWKFSDSEGKRIVWPECWKAKQPAAKKQ